MKALCNEPTGTNQRPVTTEREQVPDGGCEQGHEWVVFSTALKDVCLMVQCVNCGAMGTVDDSDEQEWCEAFDAPSEPYRWDEDSRVTVRGSGPLYVEKASDDQGEPAPSEQSVGTVA
jgi:hypothetical protein